MIFTPYLIELLEKECGRSIAIPADCEFLTLDIESKTKVHIGATTLKRLMGFTADEREPHMSTLNAIANYLGYHNWEQLTHIANKSNSAMDWHENETRSSDLREGCIVEITYLPNRRIRFRHNGNGEYTVIESVNSKLQNGDKLEISNFVLNHPLFTQNVIRDNKNLGEYTAGLISGISSINIIDK